MATCFYVLLGDSTRFLPAAARAGHQLQVPAGDFPLICTLSSTPVQRNQSSIVNAAFLLAAVKNLPGYTIQVGCVPYISGCSRQNHQFEPCFGVANQVAPLLRFGSRTSTAMAEKADPVIEIVEDEEEEWPEAGAQNVAEAEQYQDKINNIFDTLSILIHQDTKTALSDTIQNFKKVITKQWDIMGAADTDVVLRTIKDPTALYLRQHLTTGGVEVVDPPEEIPSGEEFIRKLPERVRQAEEKAFIIDIFNHAGQAHQHLAEVCANVAALAKVTDKTTLMTVINGAVRPLVQLNVPEGFLNPLEDVRAPSSEEEKREKVRKTVLPIPDATCLKHEPRNGPTRILTAAVWLKLSRKYFNEGTAKEACERFLVRAKQLSRVLTGRKYMGGTQARKRKTTDEPPAKRKKTDN